MEGCRKHYSIEIWEYWNMNALFLEKYITFTTNVEWVAYNIFLRCNLYYIYNILVIQISKKRRADRAAVEGIQVLRRKCWIMIKIWMQW